MFENEPLLVNGIGRDGDLSPGEQFVSHLYGATTQSNVDQVRLQLFSKALRCCLQQGMPWPCTFVVPTTKQRSGCKQIMNTFRCYLLQKHQPGQKNKTAWFQCGQDYLQSQMVVFILSPVHANSNARQLDAVASGKI